MKTAKFTLILLIAALSFAPHENAKAQSVSVSVNFNTFYQELNPYGRWVNNPRFGQVWIYNDINFKPYYSDGHWEYTNYGWSWISDYDWGWAPFHYGRWEEDPYYGWMWIPGYEWAPAWVSWSSCDDYYGWAPLGYGVSINVSFGSIAANRWNFIPRRNICDRDVYRYCEPYGRNNVFRNAVVINNYYGGNGGVGRYVRGPERREAERYTRNRIEERRVNYTDRSWNRGNNNRYRNDDNANGRRNGNEANRNNDNNNWNNGRRNDGTAANGSNGADQSGWRRQRDANNTPQTGDNNWRGRRQNDNGTLNNDGNGNNYPRRRDMNENRDNNNTQTENRRPQRDVNTTPQPNENSRWNRSNDQQNNNQQQRQPNERQWQQRQPAERPAQQQSAPAMEQRRMERRPDNINNGNAPRTDENLQRDRGNSGRRRNG